MSDVQQNTPNGISRRYNLDGNPTPPTMQISHEFLNALGLTPESFLKCSLRGLAELAYDKGYEIDSEHDSAEHTITIFIRKKEDENTGSD